ncbi:phosphate/phosphite/phosphonate ABC transporter substrate-binding protein [Calderihabitans maritimus]|uniref:Phosphonate ABC transporter periplasmic phosphonate-binding protein n=1 Tax=Calderihabitans maritimus TaxID=1246530 RepID=A0A1Z5HNY7_9FIRM|nr:phosphate/phosphite/phosphonate ABC transporter substrate-binding protein [Calderihabitans maritimus]GAW91242.1 phosphonate ABC transporter periplasmic phosphonate-binding protein [Calderihabitans maritimus]
MNGRRLLLLVIGLVLLLFFAGCSRTKDYPQINFQDLEITESFKKNTEQDSLRVALSSITSTRKSISYYEELLRLLEKTLGRPIEVVQRNTYAEVNELLRTGQIDLAFICTYSYVTGHDQFGLELVAAPVRDGKTKYQSYIIVRKDSEIDSFEQLEGKKFAFTDPMSTTGYLYPMALLREQNKEPESFFSDYSFTYSHDNSIKAVQQGVVDGAAVESLVFKHMAEKEPEIINDLKIIKKSPAYFSPPVVVRPGLPEELKKQLKEFFINLDSSGEGRYILDKMGLEGYRQVEDSDYDSVRLLGKVVQSHEK